MWTAALVDWVRTACDATRVELLSDGLGSGVHIPDGDFEFAGDPCHPRPIVRVSTGAGALTVRPSLTIWRSVPVATEATAVGDAVPWTFAEAELGSYPGAPVESGEWIAAAPIAAGDVLTALTVTPRPDVRAGTTLALAVRSGALEIRSDARLLRDARIGDEVRVYVPATRRVVVGTLVSPDRVERDGG